MASSNTRPTFDMDESRSSGGNQRSKVLRTIPRSWIIAAVLFYCASVITVGLLAGLLPRRTQHITILATPTPITTTESGTTAGPIVTTTSTSSNTSSGMTTTTTSQIPSGCIDDECNPRLAADLLVDSYELLYTYNSTEQTTVPGQVTIEFTLKQPVKQLIYHSKRMLQLEEPALFEDGVYRLITMRTYTPHDYVTLNLPDNSLFAPNRYRLIQKFVISLTDGNEGFYQSVFQDGNGTIGKLLSTDFEPTNARKAFPCFDEPHLKAKFRINLVHPENTIALSNFPTEEETTENGLRHTRFDETFRMSTYLAAWAILPDTYGTKPDIEAEPMITVWARRDPTEKNHTALALEIASKVVPFFTDYFNTEDAVPPKIDMLTVPEFSSGAMENWGLITYREDRIIVDDRIVSTYQKQHLQTISHELAHFWFGNYVTCKWWDDLWLNEAMATWLSYKPFTAHYPDWNLELQVLTEEVIPVMWDDAKPSSHPIVVENVTDAADIISLFDSITYSKGASILRMLERTVGSEIFRDSLQEYLTINAFDVGDPSVFYNKLFSNISGEEFMKSWLQERNYPLVKVNLAVENNSTKVTFTQSRFIISNVLNSSFLNPNYRWKINLQCVLGGVYPNLDTADVGGGTIEFFLESEQETRVLPGKTFSWIKCNRNFQGFYVTEYSLAPSTYAHFLSILEEQPNFFSDEDKVNFIQDAFLLAYKGLIDYNEPLQLLQAVRYTSMIQFVNWRTFQWHWETLAAVIDYLPDILPKFQDFAIKAILHGDVTLDSILTSNVNDDHNTKLVKGLQFAFLCRMNHTEAIGKANELFKSIPAAYFNNGAVEMNVGADLLSTVYTYHLKNDQNVNDWNMMYSYYKIAISPQEQTRALVAISSTTNKDRLNQLLNEGLTSTPNVTTIRRQDYFSMVNYMSHHPVGRETVWEFFRNNYDRLVDFFTLENRRFGTAILSIARSFEKASYLDEMNQFFARYPNAGAGASARKQAIDQVNMNIEWIRSRAQNLRNALDIVQR